MKTRICKNCNIEYPETSEFFYVGKRHKGGFFTLCKFCARQKSIVYHHANKEERIKKHREWKNNRDKEEKRLYDRTYSASHPEVAARSRQKRKGIYGGNPYRENRRAQKLNSGGTFKPKDIIDKYKAQHGKCFYCGIKLNKKYHIDHVVPLSRGGSNFIDNIVLACPSCNCSKGNKMLHEWCLSSRLI
jgi:5-methylcytosine-specific restriction endonuclease McrA